jgi:hypothetical protein
VDRRICGVSRHSANAADADPGGGNFLAQFGADKVESEQPLLDGPLVGQPAAGFSKPRASTGAL